MPPQSTAMLTSMGSQYAPLAPGLDAIRPNPLQGVPGLGGSGLGGLFGMSLLPQMQRAFGQVGMLPMGTGHDQNIYDRLLAQRYSQAQMRAMQMASEIDRSAFEETFRGLANVTGTPYGSAQRQAARSVSNLVSMGAPIFAAAFPDTIDQLAGSRGSAVILTQRMMNAGRYRIDPVTGRMGYSAESAAAEATRLYRQLYSPEEAPRMMSISAGQAGAMYGELQARGMISTAASEMGYGGIRGDSPRAATLRAVESLRSTAPQLLRQAGQASGVDVSRGIEALSASEIDKLNLDPRIADRIRSFDTDRIRRTLRGYASAISTMRDIFGDMGRPNAPMQELIQGLEALTAGSMAQLDPGRLSMMARTTHNLARQTGVTLDNALVMQQHAAARAQQLGLEPVFAVQANQGGLAFGGAYRAQGHAAHTAWGAFDATQVQQMDVNLRVQAAASPMANRLATAARLAEQVGGFATDSDAGRLMQAMRLGLNEWRDGQGRQRSMMMSHGEFIGLMTSARTASGQAAGISEDDVRTMAAQHSTNRAYTERLGLTDIVRRAQGRDELHPFVSGVLRDTIFNRLRQQLVAQNPGMTMTDAGQQADAISRSVSGTVARRMFGMSTEEFADNTRRNRNIGDYIEQAMNASGQGGILAGMAPEQRRNFLTTTAERFYGSADTAIQQSQYRAFQNLQNVFRLTSQTALDGADQQRLQARITSSLQQAMAPLGTNSILANAVEALRGSRSNDPGELLRVVAQSVGGVNIQDINARLLPHFRQVQEHQRRIETLRDRVSREDDPASRAALVEQLNGVINQLRGQVSDLARAGEPMGLFAEGGLSAQDLTDAQRSARALVTARNDVVGLSGNFGNAVTPQQLQTMRNQRRPTAPWQAETVLLMRAQQQRAGATMADVKPEDVQRMLRDGFGNLNENEARALILRNRQMMSTRASAAQVSAVQRSYTGTGADEARELANARLRAQKLGIDQTEIDARLAGRPRNAQHEMDAIAELFGERVSRNFTVTQADRDELVRQQGAIKDEDVHAFQNARPELQGLSFAEAKQEFTDRAVRHQRQRQRDLNLTRFLGSDEGATFRGLTENSMRDVATVAQRLIQSPRMTQRLGTRAIEYHEQLNAGQERLRLLARQYAGGDVSRLAIGHLTIQEDTAERRDLAARVRTEATSIQRRERRILSELAEQVNVPGRQFRLGDESQARHAVMLREVERRVQAAGPGADRAQIQQQVEGLFGAGATLSTELQQQVRSERETVGNVEEARRLLGFQDRTNLNADEQSRLRQMTYDVAVARRLSPEQSSQIGEYAEARRGMEQFASQFQSSYAEMRGAIVSGRRGGDISLTGDDAQSVQGAQSAITHAEERARPLRARLQEIQQRLAQPNLPDAERRALQEERSQVLAGLASADNEIRTAHGSLSQLAFRQRSSTTELLAGSRSAVKFTPLTSEEERRRADAVADRGSARAQYRQATAELAARRRELEQATTPEARQRIQQTIRELEGRQADMLLRLDRSRNTVAADAARRGVHPDEYLESGAGRMSASQRADFLGREASLQERGQRLDAIASQVGAGAAAQQTGMAMAAGIAGGPLGALGAALMAGTAGRDNLAGVVNVETELLRRQQAAQQADNISPLQLAGSVMQAFGFQVGEEPSQTQRRIAEQLGGPSGHAFGQSLRRSAANLQTTAERRAGGARGLSGVDAMLAQYRTSTSAEEIAQFQEQYGFGDVTSGEGRRRWEEFQGAVQFQEAQGFNRVGAGRTGPGAVTTPEGLSERINRSLRMGEMNTPTPADQQNGQSGRMELSGTVTISLADKTMDMAGAYGGGRNYVGV